MKHDVILNQPVIDAGHFDLRPIRRADKGMIEFYGSDERIAKMTTSIPHPLPPGLTDDYLTRAMAEDRTEDVWVLDATKTGGAEVMGVVSLQRLDRNQSEVHYWVAPAFWNDGVARTAVQALTLANPLENSTYFASVFRDNEASAKVLTHCGFDYLGDAESFSLARNTTVPTWTYLKKLG